MAVLKILVSVALLGTATRCQDIYSAYNPGGNSGQYSPSIYSRGTPRLVPVKVRSSASRFFPSYFYPGPPPPPPSPYYPHHKHSASSMSPMQALSSSYSSHSTPTYPRHPQIRSALTGYYRSTRQSSIYNNPFLESGQPVQYHTSATTAPVVLKRGRVLPAPPPYSLEAASVSSPSTATALGGFPYSQNIPSVSAYRPSQPQPQQQRISASPVYHQPQHQPQYQVQPQYQQPTYYLQKSPVTQGAGRPVKVVKVAKKPLPRPIADVEEAEEEYPGDPNPQYNFNFDIKDDEMTNYQNRQEERDGQTIKGSYSVVDPDGYVRTVTYTADPKNGFQAKVTREPTDVKIKFPVPTEAPAAAEQHGVLVSGKHAGAPRRGQYVSPQAQYQPQYQTAAYATPQVYASEPQVQVQPQPQYVPRVVSRFAAQPQSSLSSQRTRIARRVRRPTVAAPVLTEEQEQEEQ